jgi:hypothetical protein
MILFKLINIQALKDATIAWDDKEIVEFVGDNSNGKSILSKTLDYMVKGDIFDKHIRKDLINDEEDVAQFWIKTDKKTLGIILYRNGTESYFTWGKNGEELNRRRATEGGFKEVLYDFGFRFYQKGEVCLQVFPTYGPIPFITTSGTTNKEIYDDLTSDKIADDFLSLYGEYTSTTFKLKEKEFRESKERIKSILDNIVEYDYEAYEKLGRKMKEYLLILKNLEFFDFEDINVPPNVCAFDEMNFTFEDIPIYNEQVSLDIEPFEFNDIPVYPIKDEVFPEGFIFDDIPVSPNITIPILDLDDSKVTKSFRNYFDALNKRCPTCGRLLSECDD